MKILTIITVSASLIIGCALMYFALSHMTINEICITMFFIVCLLIFIAGSMIKATKSFDAMQKCKHDKFIGDVCAGCGYCYTDKKL